MSQLGAYSGNIWVWVGSCDEWRGGGGGGGGGGIDSLGDA